MQYGNIYKKTSPYILQLLARDYILSTKSIANGLKHSSTSDILKYLESMKDIGLIEEFYEIIANVKHNRKHRLAHYLVKSESVKRASSDQHQWIKDGKSIVDGVDIKQNIIGRLLAVLICKECKKKLDYITMGDDYKKYNTASCHVLKNSKKPVRHWSLTIEGIFYLISLPQIIKKIREVRRLTRKYSDMHEVLHFASLLRDEDLQLLAERLMTARKIGLNLIQDALKWRYEVNLNDKKYSDSSWKKILSLKQRHLQGPVLFREAKLQRNAISSSYETKSTLGTKMILDLGMTKIGELIQNRISELKSMSFDETEEISVLERLSKQIPPSWHKSMLKTCGISQ